jgi:hypothetical protein
VEHKFLFEVLEELHTALDVDEERVDLSDVLNVNLSRLALLRY